MSDTHPDDEGLSAYLDDAGDPEQAAHLPGCAACRARLEDLRTVRAAVAAPVDPLARAAVDRAVRAALDAWEEERGSAGGGDVVVPLTRPLAPPKTPYGPGAGATPARAGRRLPPWALAAAAGVAGLLVAVPLIARDGGQPRPERTLAAAPERDQAQRGDEEAALGDGGDLGEQSDPAVLGRIVGAALSPSGPLAADGQGGDGPTQEAGGGTARTAAPAAAPEAASATTGAAPGAAAPCSATTRATYGSGLGPLVYTASLRWKATPAVVLAYRLADGGPAGAADHRVFVMARDGCALLVVQTL